eukprot:CAMPEP_0115003120 /NCGR_PEP_ID=MMETSP0216-20121206/18407_1 /TAXON_ID=223996 /ORGANISM="Protocruzia adherens, Strain Boccale" /LENGTH=213 /DNA_ID=CAMNT_0002368835 /DNA_START=17 /DNA_END=658 /DNA_ORIENTATION=-
MDQPTGEVETQGKPLDKSYSFTDFSCPICLNLFYKPVTNYCGHNYCHACILQAVASGAKECPLCRAAFVIDVRKFSQNTLLNEYCQRRYFSQYSESEIKLHDQIIAEEKLKWKRWGIQGFPFLQRICRKYPLLWKIIHFCTLLGAFFAVATPVFLLMWFWRHSSQLDAKCVTHLMGRYSDRLTRGAKESGVIDEGLMERMLRKMIQLSLERAR